jgi:hypothetical protein
MFAMSNFEYTLWVLFIIAGLVGWAIIKAAKDFAGTSVGKSVGSAALKKWFG